MARIRASLSGSGGGGGSAAGGDINVDVASASIEIDTGLSEVSKFIVYKDTATRLVYSNWDSNYPTKYVATQIWSTSGYSATNVTLNTEANSACITISSVSGGIVTLKAPSSFYYSSSGIYHWFAI